MFKSLVCKLNVLAAKYSSQIKTSFTFNILLIQNIYKYIYTFLLLVRKLNVVAAKY